MAKRDEGHLWGCIDYHVEGRGKELVERHDGEDDDLGDSCHLGELQDHILGQVLSFTVSESKGRVGSCNSSK